MKKTAALLLMLMLTVALCAQQQAQGQKFDPAKFDAEQQQFITKRANLTEQEAARFFPLYREMQKKQRAIYERQRKLGFKKPADEKGCEQAIRERDQIDLELKQIQQTYHNKFMKVLSASKLYDVLQAEDHFFRFKLRSWGNPGAMGNPGVPGNNMHRNQNQRRR
jgi:Spy/CpxP family protein refolding chaperone